MQSLCAHYLFNQWLEFDQTSIDISSGLGKEVIRFRWPWPYFQCHYIINTQKVSLVNAVKSMCAHYLFNQLLVLLDFGDLDFIFSVMPALWNLNFVRKRFYALCGGYRISAAYWQFSFFLKNYLYLLLMLVWYHKSLHPAFWWKNVHKYFLIA